MTDLDRLVRLSSWWWSLTDEEREQIRDEFIERMRTDRRFAKDVMKILDEEKPYNWSSV